MSQAIAPPDGYRWVSCARSVNWTVAEYRHLIKVTPPAQRLVTTVCGASASTPDLWRGNRRKPPCPDCLRKAREEGLIPKEATMARDEEQDTAMLDQPDPDEANIEDPDGAEVRWAGTFGPKVTDGSEALDPNRRKYVIRGFAPEVLLTQYVKDDGRAGAQVTAMTHNGARREWETLVDNGDPEALEILKDGLIQFLSIRPELRHDLERHMPGVLTEYLKRNTARAPGWVSEIEAADRVVDGSPEGRIRALPGWAADEVERRPVEAARDIVDGLSLREYREMLGRLEDRLRANAHEKEELIFLKEFARTTMLGLG